MRKSRRHGDVQEIEFEEAWTDCWILVHGGLKLSKKGDEKGLDGCVLKGGSEIPTSGKHREK